jgi:hypothetical protein
VVAKSVTPLVLALVMAGCAGRGPGESTEGAETVRSGEGSASGMLSEEAGPAETDDSAHDSSSSLSTQPEATSDSGTTNGDDSGGRVSGCWQHFIRADCELRSDECTFEGEGGSRYLGETCTAEPELGWCAPKPFGGFTAPSTWWEPTTGRVLLFGVIPTNHPPGWEMCSDGGGQTCPSDIEACQVCVCE